VRPSGRGVSRDRSDSRCPTSLRRRRADGSPPAGLSGQEEETRRAGVTSASTLREGRRPGARRRESHVAGPRPISSDATSVVRTGPHQRAGNCAPDPRLPAPWPRAEVAVVCLRSNRGPSLRRGARRPLEFGPIGSPSVLTDGPGCARSLAHVAHVATVVRNPDRPRETSRRPMRTRPGPTAGWTFPQSRTS